MDELAPKIPSLWARTLFREYDEALGRILMVGSKMRSIRRDVPFFIMLGERIERREDLSGVKIIRCLGCALVVRHARAMSFLCSAGYITAHEDPDYDLEFRLGRIRLFIETAPAWSTPVLTRFLDHTIRMRVKVLDGKKRGRIPQKASSIEMAIRSAVKFLHFCDDKNVTSVQGLNQDQLELYLGKEQGHNQLRAFVRYLCRREHVFGKMRIPTIRCGFNLNNLISESRRIALIEQFANPDESRRNQCWSLVALFALQYMQPPHRSVAMRLDQIVIDGDRVHALFAKVWIELDSMTAEVVQRWLSIRRENSCFEHTGESVWLFPGRLSGNHLRPSGLQSWLSPYGVVAPELLQTSIVSWVTQGIGNPGVLVDAFGLSRATAVRYYEHLGIFEAPQARHARCHLS